MHNQTRVTYDDGSVGVGVGVGVDVGGDGDVNDNSDEYIDDDNNSYNSIDLYSIR